MCNEQLTFNDLPEVVQNLFNKVVGIEEMLQQLLANQPKCEPTNDKRPLSVDQACEYLGMPKPTFYYKVQRGEIPAVKQGKRYYIYKDELDRWLESGRKNEVPESMDAQNSSILASHRRKPKPLNW